MLHHSNSEVKCGMCAQKLMYAHKDLHDWFNNIVKPAFPKVHVSWSFRGKADQDLAYANGKSKLKFPDSPHNKIPALALDLFVLSEEGEAQFPTSLYSLINKMNVDNHQEGIQWGGTFKGLHDFDHFQLKV